MHQRRYTNTRYYYKKEPNCSVAYLGFHKGGTYFLWPLMLTQRGAKPSFPMYFLCQNIFCLAQGGPWPNGPLNTPLEFMMSQACDAMCAVIV